MIRFYSIALLGTIAATATAASPYLSKVYDYRPAPGQFVNTMPEYEEGDTQVAINAKVAEALCGEKMPGMITLGSYGGYVVVGFDHPVVNVHGRYDFKIYGNAFFTDGAKNGNAEPGIVMVSVDSNGNGLPDDEWYQLAGSEYRNSATIHNFRITYQKPPVNKEIEIDPKGDKNFDPDPNNPHISDRTYVKYTTNDELEPEGYVVRNVFHKQPYWPQWLSEEELTFDGTRLPGNVIENDGMYCLVPFKWGYADNMPNDDLKGFSLDWAVDAEGKPVLLEKADFIKIYTGQLQTAGWLGETSTEVSGGEDLHPDAVYSPQWPSDPIDPDQTDSVSQVETTDFALLGSNDGMLTVRTSEALTIEIYATDGNRMAAIKVDEGESRIDMSALTPGLYIISGRSKAVKFIR